MHASYSIAELANLAGVSVRTVRYYQAQGLLASPGVQGSRAAYGDSDVDRLRLIRKLQREHLPLAEIRRRLAGLDNAAIASLIEIAEEEPIQATPSDSALDYIRAVLANQSGPGTGTPAVRALP